MEDADKENITRKKGLFGQFRRKGPDALHHFKVFFNANDKARLIYRFDGKITFVKNEKNA